MKDKIKYTHTIIAGADKGRKCYIYKFSDRDQGLVYIRTEESTAYWIDISELKTIN